MKSLLEILFTIIVATIFSVKIVENRQNQGILQLNKTLKNLHHNQKLNTKQIKYIKKELSL